MMRLIHLVPEPVEENDEVDSYWSLSLSKGMMRLIPLVPEPVEGHSEDSLRRPFASRRMRRGGGSPPFPFDKIRDREANLVSSTIRDSREANLVSSTIRDARESNLVSSAMQFGS